ncbi:MAG: O-antigen ligase family protein [Sedimentisphaerales bacterium]|nr:O-antigen ligase family protein [Sedimentisphaerales bacterium]
MTKPAISSVPSKSKAQVALDYILLGICLCVIALRVTLTEGPIAQTATKRINLGSDLISLGMSTVFITAFLLWLVSNIWQKKFLYRPALIEIGLIIFIIAAVVASTFASDKRTAITSSVIFIAPALMAILLVQILDSSAKIKIVLVVVGALGIVSAYKCSEQFFVSNQMTIEQYEQDPQSLLKALGIKEDSFEHMLFEHRLYSRGIRGFFTNRNSAGAFACLAAFAALGLLFEKWKNFRLGAHSVRKFPICFFAVAVIVFSLAITRSKGASAAFLVMVIALIGYLLFGRYFKKHRKFLFAVVLAAAVLGGCVFILYGITHKTLPGGSSMLVRWQYWQGALKMYADNPLKGVGPGNFVHFYTHYKEPAALESVADPHNFLLSILTQYGPIGLFGFLAMILVPLFKVFFAGYDDNLRKSSSAKSGFQKTAFVFLTVSSLTLLVVRVMLIPIPLSEYIEVNIYIVFTMYLAPVAAFFIGFWILAKDVDWNAPVSSAIFAAIFFAVLACLIHNLIDFAVFEPGILTVFWVFIACLVAALAQRKNYSHFVLAPSVYFKGLITLSVIGLVWVYSYYALLPVAKTTSKIKLAHQMVSTGRLERAHKLLSAAAEADPLSQAALSLNGRLYLSDFYDGLQRNETSLLKAQEFLLESVGRNKADYRDYERLVEVYMQLYEISDVRERTDWLDKAYVNARSAVERYPGCARLRVELAKITERLGKKDSALKQYKKAIEIEDAYRQQFKLIYPRREVFSRLGRDNYEFARKRLEKLGHE